MGFMSVLTLLFIALKLMNFIDWSWWLVLLPTILHIGMLILVVVVGLNAVRKKK
jgi:hypothetical protein